MSKQIKAPWHIHVPMTVFTAATIVLTVLDHSSMAIYFAVLTFLAFAGSSAVAGIYDKDKEEKK